jgi:hypothetical protein
MKARAMALAAALALPFGCSEPTYPAQAIPCNHVGGAGDVSALYRQHGRSIVVIGESAWLCPCTPERRLAGAVETRQTAGAVEDRASAGAAEDRRLAGDTTARRQAGDGEDRRLTGDAEDRRGDGAVEDRRLAGDTEGRALSLAAEERQLAGASEVPSCTPSPTCSGYVVSSQSPTVAVFDGRDTRAAADHCIP